MYDLFAIIIIIIIIIILNAIQFKKIDLAEIIY